MITFNKITGENTQEHCPQWLQIPDNPYRMLIVDSSGSEMRYSVNHQRDIDKIYLHSKDKYELKYQYLMKKREKVGLKHFKDPKPFIENSNDMIENH